ncbi:MAG: hypothetical protein FJ095_04475 [Deltaproteobacteria bacterium]|nr:hypothetical protein [Deltaproteobacteria bacterium]
MIRGFSLVLAVLVLGAACGGGAALGEPCDNPGTTDECIDGAVCTNESSSEGNLCRLLCDDQEDCPDGYQCSGITNGNLKSCKPSDK